jgi:putative colanic acid biosynthesis glycosyltransferase
VPFSIVTVCRNDLANFRYTESSIRSQTYPLREWIVVDGASSDGTPAHLATIHEPYLSWMSEPDAGLYDAMNKGIALAKGDYLIFMNSGDAFFSASTLADVAARIDRPRPDIVYGDAVEFADTREFYKSTTGHRYHHYSMFTPHQAIFYRSTAIKARRYDTSYRVGADWALTSSMLQEGASAQYIFLPICRYRRGGLSQSNILKGTFDPEIWRLHRNVHRLSIGRALALTFLKRSVNLLRIAFPQFYDAIRMRKLR